MALKNKDETKAAKYWRDHHRGKLAGEGRLCHKCGYEAAALATCPRCGTDRRRGEDDY